VPPSRAADPHKVPIDPNGNLTSKVEGTDSWAYTWNAENQLTRVEKNGAEVARFAYDPRGRRVQKIAGGTTTKYSFDGKNIMREVRGTTDLSYVHGVWIDSPLAMESGQATVYLHADALETVVRITDGSGSVALSREYDAWGQLQAGWDEPGYSFTGREWDPETGLYYYRARYYDPKSGRFISEDPLPLAERRLSEVGAYPYVGNDPVNSVDPYGLEGSSGRNIHGNYCGPVNGGDPLDRVDDCCVLHDQCYTDAGLTWKATFSSQKKKLPPDKQKKCNDCDRQLCLCLKKLLFETPSPMWKEAKGMSQVEWYFSCSKYDKK
jgi:RHS repeat-associated protein